MRLDHFTEMLGDFCFDLFVAALVDQHFCRLRVAWLIRGARRVIEPDRPFTLAIARFVQVEHIGVSKAQSAGQKLDQDFRGLGRVDAKDTGIHFDARRDAQYRRVRTGDLPDIARRAIAAAEQDQLCSGI